MLVFAENGFSDISVLKVPPKGPVQISFSQRKSFEESNKTSIEILKLAATRGVRKLIVVIIVAYI